MANSQGIGIANSQKKVVTPALWEKDTKYLFCDLCISEIEKGNRPTTFFNKEGWDNIISKFKDLTGREYDRVQLKNKWDQLKKDWKLWTDLKRGSTGLGWDPVRRTVDASEEWWNERLAIIPAAKKFRSSGIEPDFEAKLQTMFGGVVASGMFAVAPSQTVFESTPENVAVELSNDSGEFRSVDIPEIQSTNRTKRPRNSGKRKISQPTVREQLSYLVESSNDAPHKIQKTAVLEVVGLLEDDPDFTMDTELFFFAVDLFLDSLHRDFFTSISKERRVACIRYYYNRRHL